MSKCNFNKVALLCKFTEITLQHGCSPVNLLHIFRTPFPKNTCRGLLLTSHYRASERVFPFFSFDISEAYSKHSRTSKMEVFAKIVIG